MYEQFYGFSALPFSLLPDADFLFLSERHRRAVNLLEYGMMSQAGFIVITGEVGAGKTTIIRKFLKSADQGLAVGVISNPSKTLGRLLSWVAMAFEFEDSGQDQARTYDSFIKFLLARYSEGRRSVLIIDEAQNLSADMLEDLRMLSNVNNEKDQLLQIVLVGQPELLETLNRADLKQFAQRIAVHCHLDPLTPGETAAYIHHRLHVAGAKNEIFNDIACAAVYFFTGGVPRLINLLCDQALVYTFSQDGLSVSPDVIAEVVLDRARSGLSAFRELPQGWNARELVGNITGILREMRA